MIIQIKFTKLKIYNKQTEVQFTKLLFAEVE